MRPDSQAALTSLVEARFRNMIGLEVGGPSDLFRSGGLVPIYELAERVDNCNFQAGTVWSPAFVEGPTFNFAEGKKPGFQFIREAADLRSIGTSSYDFVCSSHTLEHCANPIRALREWARVLKADGHLFIILPHRDGTFDHRRPVTQMPHLVADDLNGADEHDLTHLPEILELHDLSMDPGGGTPDQFKRRSLENFGNRCLHQHVFDTALMVHLLDHCGFQLLAVDQFLPFHIVAFARAPTPGSTPDNSAFMARRSSCYVESPFPSDRPRLPRPLAWVSRLMGRPPAHT